MDALVVIVGDGIRILRTRDGVPLTDEQINERARNIVAALVGNYDVKEIIETCSDYGAEVIGFHACQGRPGEEVDDV